MVQNVQQQQPMVQNVQQQPMVQNVQQQPMVQNVQQQPMVQNVQQQPMVQQSVMQGGQQPTIQNAQNMYGQLNPQQQAQLRSQTMQVGGQQVPLTNVVNQIQSESNSLEQQTNVTRGELQTFLNIMGKKFATLKNNQAKVVQGVAQQQTGKIIVNTVQNPAAPVVAKALPQSTVRKAPTRQMPGPVVPAKPRAVTMTPNGPVMQVQGLVPGRTFPGWQRPATVGRQTQNGVAQPSTKYQRVFPKPMHETLVMPRQTSQVNAIPSNARIFPTARGLAIITPHNDTGRQMSVITNPYYARGLSQAGMMSDRSVQGEEASGNRRLKRK